MLVQVCFQIKDEEHNEFVKRKLKELKNKLNPETDKVLSCHLPKPVVESKGWNTDMCDALIDTFGDMYECQVIARTFEEAIKTLTEARIATAKKVDRIYVIGTQDIGNIDLEIQYFTDNKVQFIQA